MIMFRELALSLCALFAGGCSSVGPVVTTPVVTDGVSFGSRPVIDRGPRFADGDIALTYSITSAQALDPLPYTIPADFSSITLRFQAHAGFGFTDSTEVPQDQWAVDGEGIVVDNVDYGGSLGNGLYSIITVQFSRESDPPASLCELKITALPIPGFVYPEWSHLYVEVPLNSGSVAFPGGSDVFDSDGIVNVRFMCNTGFYFDYDNGNFYGSTGQLDSIDGASVLNVYVTDKYMEVVVKKVDGDLVPGQNPRLIIRPLGQGGGGSPSEPNVNNAFDLLRTAFSVFVPVFMLQVLPGYSLGIFLVLPLIVTLVLFILKALLS